MAASDYDFNVTRNQLINRAMRIVGALALGQSITAEELSNGAEVLNAMVKSWQSRGVFLWNVHDLTLSLTNGNVSYTLSTDPPIIDIDRAFIREGTTDTVLERISWFEYRDLPTKSDSGKPVKWAIDPVIVPTFYVWPVPTQSYTVYYTGIGKLKDFDAASSTPYFPTRWIDALAYGLASALSDEYHLSISERDRLERRAEFLFALAKKSDRSSDDCEFVKGAY